MDFRESLSILFPPPRDDEPPSLRQDILDELGDHLACAYNHELLRGADSQCARQRVLKRFGDPASVARRLWLDAMKGKIMAQRVLIATCLVVALASLSMVGLVWLQSSRAAAQSNEANRQLSQALAQSQIANNDMMKTLNEMTAAIRNPRSPDWNPVKIKLTEDTADGTPAVDCTISLSREGAGNSTIDRTTDASGIADFGLLHPGTYAFSLSKSREYGSMIGSGQFNVEPGSDVTKLIACPKKALERVPLRIRCNWPADLEKEGLVVDASFNHDPLLIEETSWSIRARSVFCGPGAALTEILEPEGLYRWAASPAPRQTLGAAIQTSYVRPISETADPMKWEGGTYRLSGLLVLRPFRAAAESSGRHQYEILATCSAWASVRSYLVRPDPPADEKLWNVPRMGNGIWVDHSDIEIDSWRTNAASFEARPDRVNEWTITLPEPLINAVRAKVSPRRTTGSE